MKIALPIETKVREFRGKLWLALNLVESGHCVTIGNISSITKGLDAIEPDIYFGDSAYYRPGREKLYRRIQQSGGKVVVLDTEGGVFRSKAAYEKRLSPKILKYVDYFLAWGDRPAEIANESKLPNERIRVTGNPRFDLLQPDLRDVYYPDAQKYQDKYGEYILINTNFTIANPFDQETLETNDSDKIAYQEQLMEQFVEAIQSLEENLSEYTYIVRPHPSENHEEYDSRFHPHDNVKVKHEGGVLPWIYGATAVVHNSCTTGIESALMGTPVFSYRPVMDQTYDLELPNIVSNEVSEYTELYNALANIQKEDVDYRMTEEQKTALQQYFYNIDDRATTHITAIVDEIDDVGLSTIEYSERPPTKQRIKRVSTYTFGIKTTERILQTLTHRDYSYMRQKFPGLSSKEIREEIQNIGNHAQIPTVSITQRRSLGDVFTLSKDHR